jgi:hypothetical protein
VGYEVNEMNNQQTLALIHDAASDYNKSYYQTHKDWKRDYNKKYYREHKDYWVDYAKRKNATPTPPYPELRIEVSDSQVNDALQKALKVQRDKTDEDKRKEYEAFIRALEFQYGPRAKNNPKLREYLDSLRKKYYDSIRKQTPSGPSSGDSRQQAIRSAKTGQSYSGALTDTAKLFGYEAKQSSKNVASTWASAAKSIVSAASKYGPNWKSGAKDIISKGSSIVSGLRSKLGF